LDRITISRRPAWNQANSTNGMTTYHCAKWSSSFPRLDSRHREPRPGLYSKPFNRLIKEPNPLGVPSPCPPMKPFDPGSRPGLPMDQQKNIACFVGPIAKTAGHSTKPPPPAANRRTRRFAIGMIHGGDVVDRWRQNSPVVWGWQHGRSPGNRSSPQMRNERI
jgi:hypothetical protein